MVSESSGAALPLQSNLV